uniref:ATP-dependent RNA helicase n=1 Tax=Callorhinchus milii TaxID=7868 RepID=V9KI40_CALMI
MADEELLLNVTTDPNFPVFHRNQRVRRQAQGRGSKNPGKTKRKLLETSAIVPLPSKPTNKSNLAVKRKKNSEPPQDEQSPPKKWNTGRSGEKEETRSMAPVKTSSLFRNNPELPEIHSQPVSTLKEKVFTTDSFSELDVHPHLVSTLNKVLNVSSMTSIQKKTIPVLLSGNDALVRSQTGSGKTLAYAIPLVQSLQAIQPKIQRSDGPCAVVLVPTRELALQSFEAIQKLLKPFTWIVPGILMGGEKRKSEKARLRKGINILVTTPGRLLDHIKHTKSISFRRVQWFIIDEADRLLDLGFEKDVAAILNALNATQEKRQNVLLSATLTDGVSRLAGISLREPVNIQVTEAHVGEPTSEAGANEEVVCQGNAERDSDGYSIPEQLQQLIVLVPSKLRLVTLSAFILQKCKFEGPQKMMIFFSSCEAVEFHNNLFTKVLITHTAGGEAKPSPHEVQFLRLHGNMEQEARTKVFTEFSQSKAGVLLCTDVAARGLDLPQVTWIVQYSAPPSPAEYVHRVGRTARIGSCGNALLFLTPSEVEYAELLASRQIRVSEIKLESIMSALTVEQRKGKAPGHKSQLPASQAAREQATALQTQYENYVHSTKETLLQAKTALQSYIRAYATYPSDLKHIFYVKNLHLGHAAKSFGLRDAPQRLGGKLGVPRKRKPERSGLTGKATYKMRLTRMLQSEYASGLGPTLSSVRKQRKHQRLGVSEQLT